MSANMKNIMAMISNSNTDAVIDALDKFCEMIKELDNIDEITAQKEIFKATFKVSELKSTKGGKTLKAVNPEKKKRMPSMFNLYVKWIMPILKENGSEDGHEVKSNELMSMAADKWKNGTDPFGVFVKENTKTFKTNFPSLDVTEVFQKMRTCFEEGGDVNAVEEPSTDEIETVAPPAKNAKKTVAKTVAKTAAKKTVTKKNSPVPAPAPVYNSDSDSDFSKGHASDSE